MVTIDVSGMFSFTTGCSTPSYAVSTDPDPLTNVLVTWPLLDPNTLNIDLQAGASTC